MKRGGRDSRRKRGEMGERQETKRVTDERRYGIRERKGGRGERGKVEEAREERWKRRERKGGRDERGGGREARKDARDERGKGEATTEER